MSGSVLTTIERLLGFTLRQASFRGVPFYTEQSGGRGGRRLVVHQAPLRDGAVTEDLGRLPRSFRITAYVVGPGYQAQRDALLDAIEAHAAPGVFVHFTMGEITCSASVVDFSEHRDAGGYCSLDIEFVEANPDLSPVGASDTASALLAGVASALVVVSQAYQALTLAMTAPVALLESAAAAMTGLPFDTVGSLGGLIATVSASPTDTTATAAAVQAATQGMAQAVIAAQVAAATPDDPVAGAPFLIAVSADPSGGLAQLAAWGGALPAVGGVGSESVALAAQQAGVVALVQGNAVAALAQVYANADWVSAADADAARTQLLALLDAQVAAAAAAGQDALWRAWSGLIVLAMRDMIARAQALPQMSGYATGVPVPSLVLAQRLYRDPSRAGQLEDLNDVMHPLFMPPVGVALAL